MSVLLRTKHDSAIKIRPVKLRKQPPALTTMRKDRTMADKPDITPELLRQLLRYEPETGKLFWRPRPLDLFPNNRMGKIWNTRFSGKEAGAKMTIGYSLIRIWQKPILAHRIIWMMQYNALPLGEIDHIDGVKDNNALSNLRDVSHKENTRNICISKSNNSGFTGVFKRTKRPNGRPWAASITVDARSIYLGSFDTVEAAAAARKAADEKYGFHKNHGRLSG